MSIEEIVGTSDYAKVEMTMGELKEFARSVAAEAVSQYANTHKAARTISEHQNLLTLKETCKFLNVSRYTLRKWNQVGYLPTQKVGGRVYYRKEDLENL